MQRDGHHGESRKYGMMDEYVERVKNSQIRIQQVSCLRKKVGSRGKVQRTGPDDQGLIKHYDIYAILFFFIQCTALQTALLRSQLFRYKYLQPKFRCNDATSKRSSFPLSLIAWDQRKNKY